MQPVAYLHLLQLAQEIVEPAERVRFVGIGRDAAILVQPGRPGEVEDLPAQHGEPPWIDAGRFEILVDQRFEVL